MYDCVIIGGGIVGLASAFKLQERQPGVRVLLIEKEADIAAHQTGRNSGVIHSGIYYKPGSLKARFARDGGRKIAEFCREHGIEHRICGKVIVATEERELAQLKKLHDRGLQNELKVSLLNSDEVRNIEPHVRSIAGIHVPSTGIVNYKAVCLRLAELVRSKEGAIQLGTKVTGIRSRNSHQEIETTGGTFETRFVLNCAGLHSDRVARLAGLDAKAKIVPFRGEYYELIPERRDLVKTLIYPVPNPDFPFLGVHFTRMIDGSVHAGPNAVLAFAREGYCWSRFNLRDFSETMFFGGFWKLAYKNLGEGLMEIRRSLSKTEFVRSLQRLVPEVQEKDLVRSEAGVRAQALTPAGALVDDFLIVRDRNAMHVCNAPSPAATASLEIGNYISAEIPDLRNRTTIAPARSSSNQK